MAWKGPEPVGQIIGHCDHLLTVGARTRGPFLKPDGTVVQDVPFLVLREATVEEWLAEDRDRKLSPHHARIKAYYLISVD